MPVSGGPSRQRILVVRRDNIGDLICTTPLFSALRRRFPDAWLGALVNSYNAPVLQGNPDIDEVFAYRKLKHREHGESLLANLWARYRLVAALRRRALDYVVVAGNAARAMRLARMLRPGSVVAPTSAGGHPDIAIDVGEGHEIERTFRLARAFDIDDAPPKPTVFADTAAAARIRGEIELRFPNARRLIGIHVSARKPSQRWPQERYAELARELARTGSGGLLLFWSPGAASDPRHPGDDEKAQKLTRELREIPLVPVPTPTLGELIAGLSLCDRVICSDGGAMHLAAALAKPLVCLFGQSDAARWHPWGVPHVLLQPASRDVRDIGVGEVLAALGRLG